MTDNRPTLGQVIQHRRVELDITQAELAAVAGVNLWTLRGWEGDRRTPDIRAGCRLADALGIHPSVLADTREVSKDDRERRPAGPVLKPRRPRGRPRKPKE